MNSTIKPQLIRSLGNSDIYLLKEFKGSKYPRLILSYCKVRNYAFLGFENDLTINWITLYDNSVNFGSDYRLNKKQSDFLKSKADLLRAIKKAYIKK